MYPHLMLDPADSPFPLLPTFKIAGTAIRCACVMPLAPSIAGNLNLAATGRPKGIQISISPDHLKLIRHLVTDVDDVFQSVQHRASSIIATDLLSADQSPSQVCACHTLSEHFSHSALCVSTVTCPVARSPSLIHLAAFALPPCNCSRNIAQIQTAAESLRFLIVPSPLQPLLIRDCMQVVYIKQRVYRIQRLRCQIPLKPLSHHTSTHGGYPRHCEAHSHLLATST